MAALPSAMENYVLSLFSLNLGAIQLNLLSYLLYLGIKWNKEAVYVSHKEFNQRKTLKITHVHN
jgi:hypothetical protein